MASQRSEAYKIKKKFEAFKPLIDKIFNRNIKFQGYLKGSELVFTTAFIYVNKKYEELNKSVFYKLIEEYPFDYLVPLYVKDVDEKEIIKEKGYLYYTNDNRQF